MNGKGNHEPKELGNWGDFSERHKIVVAVSSAFLHQACLLKVDGTSWLWTAEGDRQNEATTASASCLSLQRVMLKLFELTEC